jgi:hypothetical protein
MSPVGWVVTYDVEIINRIEGMAKAFLVTYRYADPELRAQYRDEHLERLRPLAEGSASDVVSAR